MFGLTKKSKAAQIIAGLALSAILLGGCGQEEELLTIKPGSRIGNLAEKRAAVVIGPYNIGVKKNLVEIDIENPPGPPPTNTPVTVFCADWDRGRFQNRVEGGAIWKTGEFYIVVSLPTNVENKQACGITWEVKRKGLAGDVLQRVAVAFFIPDQAQQYLTQEQRKRAKP